MEGKEKKGAHVKYYFLSPSPRFPLLKKSAPKILHERSVFIIFARFDTCLQDFVKKIFFGRFSFALPNKIEQRYFLFPPFFAPKSLFEVLRKWSSLETWDIVIFFWGKKKRVAVECRADTKLPPSPKTLFTPRRRSNKNFGHREGHSVTQRREEENPKTSFFFIRFFSGKGAWADENWNWTEMVLSAGG